MSTIHKPIIFIHIVFPYSITNNFLIHSVVVHHAFASLPLTGVRLVLFSIAL